MDNPWLATTTLTELEEQQLDEQLTCGESVSYFINEFCHIYDATTRDWVPFHLWNAQYRTLKALEIERLVLILKARQLGLTWLCICYALWLMLFRPEATVMLFSRREDEAKELLRRLKGIYLKLPRHLQTESVTTQNTSHWQLSNGSQAFAFPTTAGDSYTATLVFCDEFDLVENQDQLITAVKPVIDAGGQMILVSRSNKVETTSPFKMMYRAAMKGENPWLPIFISWKERPGRTQEWYNEIRKDSITRTGSTDAIFEQYPTTEAEALAPNSLDKRIPGEWLTAVYIEKEPISIFHPRYPSNLPAQLVLFEEPRSGVRYVIGADPAEGNPTSDDSAAIVVEVTTGYQIAEMVGKIDPTNFGAALAKLSRFFNNAGVLIERNNHGHAVIQEYIRPEHRAASGTCLKGPDKKYGWMESTVKKNLLYDEGTETIRVGDCNIVSLETFLQLAEIEGATLKAPEGLHDDRAVAWMVSQAARSRYRKFTPGSTKRYKKIKEGMRIPA